MVGTNPKNPFSSFFIYRTYVKTCRFLHDRISTLLIKIILNLFVRIDLFSICLLLLLTHMYQECIKVICIKEKKRKKKKKCLIRK